MDKYISRIEKNKKKYLSFFMEDVLLKEILKVDEKFKKDIEWFNKRYKTNLDFFDNQISMNYLDLNFKKNNFMNKSLFYKEIMEWNFEIQKIIQDSWYEADPDTQNNFKSGELEQLLDEYIDKKNNPYFEGIETMSINKTGEIQVQTLEDF